MEENNPSPLLSNRFYDYLKFAVTILLPAAGALYFGLSQIWGLPYGEEVVGTFALVATFLGALLKLSDRSYEASGAKYDGTMVVSEDPVGSKKFSLEVDTDLYELDSKSNLALRIQHNQVDSLE